jgi:hypothetical protein
MRFESWDNLGRTAVSGVVAYTALILFCGSPAKRALAKLNVFDLVVTVALGSTLSTILLSRQTPLSQGLLESTTAGLEDRGDGAGAVRAKIGSPSTIVHCASSRCFMLPRQRLRALFGSLPAPLYCS